MKLKVVRHSIMCNKFSHVQSNPISLFVLLKKEIGTEYVWWVTMCAMRSGGGGAALSATTRWRAKGAAVGPTDLYRSKLLVATTTYWCSRSCVWGFRTVSTPVSMKAERKRTKLLLIITENKELVFLPASACA